ncbi:hypothetical protein BJ138DRAFT_1114711 [Hygrophoropsis aurantiaca]|uniref:Uncharacterized protein n=1 Tax=Hygrophoropsis aurantiaca TaxID=72124 RepID=A0ACB8A9F1_9AGAM|nr:hypothetical protein BJ138DRAFT_1114711 [Hygrophoropsis aurantiaca]
MSSHNRNPNGRNQHGEVLKANDETLANALKQYHREDMSCNKKISQRLLADYQITMGEWTVKRRRKELGLTGSGVTTKAMPRQEAKQLVVSQMDKDPNRRHGVRTIKHKVAFQNGVQLTRKFVSDIMHEHDSEGFQLREPTAKKIFRVEKIPYGIHNRWTGDGHDKLYKIGFPLWAVLDEDTGKWLGAWVVPSNRMGEIIAYLFLCLVEKFEGVPLQFTTDCGSETTKLYGLCNALREMFHPDYNLRELPAHIYLRSIHNIVVERSWLRLRLDWGDNVVTFFNKGIEDGFYNPDDLNQYELCQWLWPKLLRKDLQDMMDFRNSAPMRKNKHKKGPSGMSRNEAFSLYENWGGRNCLLPVDVAVIREIKEAMGGDALLDFVTPEFSQRAQAAYDTLNIVDLTLENVWHVFRALHPLVFVE